MNQRQRSLYRNYGKIYAINFFVMFLVIMPVAVPFFQSLGLSMSEVFLLQAIFSGVNLVMEVPSGYVSDLLGRKKTMIIFATCYFLSGIALALADDFIGLVIFEIFAALSVSFFSGTDTAMIYDTMDELQDVETPKRNTSRTLGKKLMFAQLGETMAALVGGWVAYEAALLRNAAYLEAMVAWIPLVIVFTLREPNRSKMSRESHRENFRIIYSKLFRSGALLRLIFLNFIFFALSSLIAAWSFQKYWESIEIDLMYFGYLWALFNLVVGLTGRFAYRFERTAGTFTSVLLIGILPPIGFLGMSVTMGWVALGLGLLIQVSRGLNMVILMEALNARVPSQMRGTINSIANLGVRGVFICLGPLMGYLIDENGAADAFQVFGFFLFTTFVLLTIPLLWIVATSKDQIKVN